jgi:hypothetical protein
MKGRWNNARPNCFLDCVINQQIYLVAPEHRLTGDKLQNVSAVHALEWLFGFEKISNKAGNASSASALT